jgi:apolipoprotein N-acyltransferase
MKRPASSTPPQPTLPAPHLVAQNGAARTWVLALAGSLLLWASFPPLNLWPLAWLAPLPWLILIRQEKLLGRRPYLQITAAGFVHWLLMLQGVRLAHPALYGGWVALSLYLAIYLVLFVSISRVAVHRLRWPLFLAAPIVWTGLEFLRANLISGFACGLLAHTQTAWPMVLQIADLGGAYLVSFVMLLVAAVVTQYLPAKWFAHSQPSHRASGPIPVAIAFTLVILTLAYGWFRLHEQMPKSNKQPLRVALIQGSLDTRFDQPHDERTRETFGQYDPLTRAAVSKEPQLDLVVWPESMFTIPECSSISEQQATDAAIASPQREMLATWQQPFDLTLQEVQKLLPRSAFLFGTTTLQFDLAKEQQWPAKNYNAALLTLPGERVSSRYYKMHPVMFGEFIPLADLMPFLYSFTPMGGGMSIGDAPVMMNVRDYTLAPNICFESTVPHLIREQVSGLESSSSQSLDAIVNVSNDGWFKGSAILDLHFRCSVFRAIENRKPVIIAANTGISAHIDGNGRVLQRGPKRATQVLIANVIPDGRSSPYHTLGDAFGWLCAAATWGVALLATLRR